MLTQIEAGKKAVEEGMVEIAAERKVFAAEKETIS